MPAIPDDGTAWYQIVGYVIAGLMPIGGLVAWLHRRIDAVRVDADVKIKAVELANKAAIDDLRKDIIGRMDGHAREYREDRQESHRWRENVLSTMVTRAEIDRLTDRQTEELLDRLDARVKPLLDREREARR
jgi:hypothetical protein